MEKEQLEVGKIYEVKLTKEKCLLLEIDATTIPSCKFRMPDYSVKYLHSFEVN